MSVNSAFKLLSKNQFVLSAIFALVIVSVFIIASSFTKPFNDETTSRQMNLMVRRLGHQLLLQTGDSTSRVLPVAEIREGTFLLQFENDLAFSHDSLIALAYKLLPKSQFPSGYTVTVHTCQDPSIVYGFQRSSETPDILACQGRTEPRGCYSIEVFFPGLYSKKVNYSVVAMICTVMAGCVFAFVLGRSTKTFAMSEQSDLTVTPAVNQPAAALASLGKFLFDLKNQRLLLDQEIISLSEKECRVLELLNECFGELVPRETLIDKVWVSEGVITGRSLDMFVSKLRKKLRGDPELKITNVHGKGYKLEAVSY